MLPLLGCTMGPSKVKEIHEMSTRIEGRAMARTMNSVIKLYWAIVAGMMDA
jgi:hypothetical protein